MRTKFIVQVTCMLLSGMLITSKIMSQQSKPAAPTNQIPEQFTKSPGSGNYTYRLFVAPNKLFGYDIFKDGRIIFHQPALAEPAGDKQLSLNKKPLADKAAALAIEKIRKGIPAELTRQEIIQITAH